MKLCFKRIWAEKKIREDISKKRHIDGEYGQYSGLYKRILPKMQKKKQLFDCFFLVSPAGFEPTTF